MSSGMRLRDTSRAAMRRRQHRHFSAWTFVAPAALLVSVVIVVSVITSTLDARRKEDRARPATTAAATTVAATTATGPVAKKFHRVKDGESFSSIADDFKTTVDALTELNPNLDPLKLTPGARIRVQ
jgi:LysM repeat protein